MKYFIFTGAARLLEGAETTVTGISDAQATSIKNSLQSLGTAILDNFVKLLPAFAGIAAIMFVVALIRKKAKC